MLSVGAGPIDRKLSRVLLRGAARAAHFISYRDEMSRDYMRSIGRDVSRDEVSADLVFGLPPTSVDHRDGRRPAVAIGVLWSGTWEKRPDARDRYRDRLVELVGLLWDGGNDVVLVIGDAADTESRDELVNALEKTDSVRARERLDCPPIRSFDDVLKTLANCEAAIVSRYHNVVAALMTATPVISLEYGFKNRALMSSAGLAEWCLHIDDFDPADVARRVATVNPQIAVEETAAVEALRAEVNQQFFDVLGTVER
jgi:polysaccharide pyruvyl transferase WcaK-like protein